MDAISCPVLGISKVTPKDFVRFWEQLYSDSDYNENFYRENIGQSLTKERIADWFNWKNRRPLSAAKTQTMRFRSKERIGHNANAGTLAAFLNQPGGAIWRIFWLHLQHPLHFPIYDQHVHRAMAFMLKWPKPKLTIPAHNPTKVREYLDDYRPFFGRFDGCDPRKVDRALWSFGRFLKSEYGRIFTSPLNDEATPEGDA